MSRKGPWVDGTPTDKAIGRRQFLKLLLAVGGVGLASIFGLGRQAGNEARNSSRSSVSNHPARHFVRGDDLAG